ncbi:hypothetical protein V2J09_007213 [Rumex salicifolius]
MELRSNQHILHHISAIKGGKVVKALNVTKGRPFLSFKDLSTILNHGSNTQTIPLADRSLHNVFDPNMVKSEEEIFNDNCIGGSSDRRSHDSDDGFFGEMTLRQLKKKCKANKGEVTRLVAKEVEQENGGSHSDEENIDLEETLGSLKRKFSGKSKSRKMQKCEPGLKITDVVVKCEPVSFNEAFIQVGSGFDMCATIKMEDPDSVSSLCQEVTSSDDFCSIEIGTASTDKVIGEMLVIGESCTTEEDSLIILQGPNVSYADSMPSEHCATAKSLPLEIPVCEEMMKVDDQGIIENVASELPGNFCSPREGSSFVAEECKICTLNQICYELEEHSGGPCLPPRSSSHEKAMKIEMQVTGESCTLKEDSLIKVQGTNISYDDSKSNECHTPANSLPPVIPVCEEMMVVNDPRIVEKIAIGLPDADCCSPRKESSLIAEEWKHCTLNQICYELEDHSCDSCLPSESSSHEKAMKIEMQVTGESCTLKEDSLIKVQGTNVSYDDSKCNECHTPANSLPPVIPVCEEMMVVNDPRIVEKIAIGLPDADCCSPRKESSLIAEEWKHCTLNQICYELEDHSCDSCLPSESSSHEEALKVRDPVMAAEQPISISALTQEDKAITDALMCNESPDILFTLCNGRACATMDDDKDYIVPCSLGTSVNHSPNSVLNQKTRGTRSIKHVGEADNYAVPVVVEADLMDDSDKVSSSFASERVEYSKLQHHPERLLSSRKTISPDSQQKLCKAMQSLDLPDYKEREKCKQRLCFEKQEVNADASSDAGMDQLLTRSSALEHSNTADTSPNSEKKIKRGKEDKKRVRAKGVNKVAPPAWYRISSACGCIQSCSQNVIDFSQQQMTDTERLAINLTKELRSMKELMIEMLHPQGRRASTSRSNINEVRVAVENATKVEDMARRCIASMTRDCNRFCKIVSLAEKNTEPGNDANSAGNRPIKEEPYENDATNNTVSKGRKKIKFADEIGGNLCNVRLIEDKESLLLDSPIENGELQSA